MHKIGTETTTAPRNLTREGQTGKRKIGMWGSVTFDAPEPPSVGGEATVEHDIWRCGSCRALAVTVAGSGTPKCGRCGR